MNLTKITICFRGPMSEYLTKIIDNLQRIEAEEAGTLSNAGRGEGPQNRRTASHGSGRHQRNASLCRFLYPYQKRC